MPVASIAQGASQATRAGYVDLFRGLLIAHMALDHTSLMYNRFRGEEELWRHAPAPPVDFAQFLTRFTGVPVAPGFCFMAGFMVATTTAARMARGVPSGDITRRLLIRGLVLLAVDAFIMGLPRMLMGGFYSFVVLSCIGASIIVVTLLRDLPQRWLIAVSVAILGLHPLIDVSALPTPLQAILYEPVREGRVRSLYPVLPWAGIVLAGYVTGRDATTRKEPQRLWLTMAAASFALFLVVRVLGGYGNAYPYTSLASLDFWFFAKYPPDLPFLTFSFGCVFLALVVLRKISRDGVPRVLAPLVVFGRVPFFFYIVHFYVLGIAQGPIGKRFGLGGTCLLWIALLVVMLAPCAWYYKKKRDRPSFITRYV